MAKRNSRKGARKHPSNSAHPGGSSSLREAREEMVIEAIMQLGDEFEVHGLTLPDGRFSVVATHITTGQTMMTEPVTSEELLAGDIGISPVS